MNHSTYLHQRPAIPGYLFHHRINFSLKAVDHPLVGEIHEVREVHGVVPLVAGDTVRIPAGRSWEEMSPDDVQVFSCVDAMICYLYADPYEVDPEELEEVIEHLWAQGVIVRREPRGLLVLISREDSLPDFSLVPLDWGLSILHPTAREDVLRRAHPTR